MIAVGSSKEMAINLYGSQEQANQAMKEAVDLGNGDSFSVSFKTVDSFISECWDLWGDARGIVSNSERILIVRKMLNEQDVFAKTVGAAKVLSAFIDKASGSDGMHLLLSGAGLESEPHSSFRHYISEFISRYYSILDGLSFIEAGEAAHMMQSVIPSLMVRLFTRKELPPAIVDLLRSCSKEGIEQDTPDIASLDPTKQVAFIRLSGPASLAKAIYKEIVEQKSSTRDKRFSIAVCASEPRTLFSELASSLNRIGVETHLLANVPFLNTGFGMACQTIIKILKGEATNPDIADFAYSVWSGMSLSDAERLDAEIRGDRAFSLDDVILMLENRSSTFKYFAHFLGGNKSIDNALDSLERHIASSGLPNKMLELNALNAYREVYDAYRRIFGDGAIDFDILDVLTVRYSCASYLESKEEAGFIVEFRDIDSLSSLARGSYDEVLLCDVSDAAFNVSSNHTFLDNWLEELCGYGNGSALDQVRDSFLTAFEASCSRFACVIPLRDKEHERAYPSFVFEEFLSAYVGHPVDIDDFSKTVHLLDPATTLIGEDDLVPCIGKNFTEVDSTVRLKAAERGKLSYLNLVDYLRKADTEVPVPILSPSAIEKYISCPYKWFIENCVGTDSLDEGFGPLEMGVFVHEVLNEYYCRSGNDGSLNKAGWVADGAEILNAVFDDVLERQKYKAGTRLVPITVTEAFEVELLRKQLLEFLKILNSLPKDYFVYGHEVSIDPCMNVDYAGVRLNGRADRVDMKDDKSKFAVLDYKGSIQGYSAGDLPDVDPESYGLPEKIQVLVYAQALRRIFKGCSCSAAAYLSYKATSKRGSVAGSIDFSSYPIQDLSTKSSEVILMDEFLDIVEDKVRPHMDALVDGDIHISELSVSGCRYCSYRCCERNS